MNSSRWLGYLPETVNGCLSLPPAYARYHRLENGKSAQELFLEQLETMENATRDLTHAIHAQDLQALQANGRFLREKFSTPQSWLAK